MSFERGDKVRFNNQFLSQDYRARCLPRTNDDTIFEVVSVSFSHKNDTDPIINLKTENGYHGVLASRLELAEQPKGKWSSTLTEEIFRRFESKFTSSSKNLNCTIRKHKEDPSIFMSTDPNQVTWSFVTKQDIEEYIEYLTEIKEKF